MVKHNLNKQLINIKKHNIAFNKFDNRVKDDIRKNKQGAINAGLKTIFDILNEQKNDILNFYKKTDIIKYINLNNHIDNITTIHNTLLLMKEDKIKKEIKEDLYNEVSDIISQYFESKEQYLYRNNKQQKVAIKGIIKKDKKQNSKNKKTIKKVKFQNIPNIPLQTEKEYVFQFYEKQIRDKIHNINFRNIKELTPKEILTNKEIQDLENKIGFNLNDIDSNEIEID